MYNTIAFYGGTFSPPHNGHVHAARIFNETVKPDKLLIIPTAIPPHKNTVSGASDNDRLAMCRLAFSTINGAEVSDLELARGGKSYTADTIATLKASCDRVAMLIGTDMLLTLDSWYHPAYIFANADIYCLRREDDVKTERLIADKNEEYLLKYGKKVIMLTSDAYPMSSTDIRDAVRRGGALDDLPASVASYIREEGLYQ